MATGFYAWAKSLLAASNATADSQINWAEGMSPSAVNDSARMMMGKTADWRDDIGGKLTTAGTSTAYTVATNQIFAALSDLDGRMITIVPHATSGAAPTLSVDGLTAIAINYSTGSAVPSGALKIGTPYALVYFSASTEFILLGAFAALPPLAGPCPVGAIMDWPAASAPTGWLLLYGQAISRTTYATLFALIGTYYNTGGEAGTDFRLPDCRGRVVAGQDNMGGSSANRLTGLSGGINGDTLGAVGGVETHTLTEAQLAAHDHDAGTLAVTAVASVSPLGWGTAGGNIGTVTAGQLVVGSGNFENTESLESLRAAANTLAGTAIAVTGSASSAGSGTAHNNVQPTIIFNKIIFAGV